jgi:signal transduction histidine kinase
MFTRPVNYATWAFPMPGHAAEKIFDPFFTTKDPGKGTSLGLSICKSIVESFQGQIQFDTAENEGTSFEIVFPKP